MSDFFSENKTEEIKEIIRYGEWASKLAESDKGWFYKQEKWLDDYTSDQKSKDAPVSASRSTIYLNCYMKT